MPFSGDTHADLLEFRRTFETGQISPDYMSDGRTFLHNLAEKNCLRIAEYLLRNNANAGIVTKNNFTSLHLAVCKSHDYMVGLILKYSGGRRVREFIDAKTSDDGSTALHLAAKNNSYESVRLLLSYGANYEAKNHRDQLPMELVTMEKAKRLLQSTGDLSRAVLVLSDDRLIIFKKKLILLPILEFMAVSFARNRLGFTSLQNAIDSRKISAVKAIIETRIARLSGDFAMPGSTEQLREKVWGYWNGPISYSFAKLKMDGNLSAKVALKEGSYILMHVWMIIMDYEKYKKTLDEPYEDPFIRIMEETLEVMGFDPKHFEGNYEDDAEFFETKAQGTRYYQLLTSSNPSDRQSFTDIVQAVFRMAMIHLIKALNSANLLVAVKKSDRLNAEKYLKESSFVNVNIRDVDDRRPLHVAAWEGNLSMIQLLLKKEANMLLATVERNETPLHIAVSLGHRSIVKCLLRNCDDDNVADFVNAKIITYGVDALKLAVWNDRIDIVRILMEYQANYRQKDLRGLIASDLATSDEMIKLFEIVDEAFEDARNGNVLILEKFKNLKNDFLLAIGNVRNEDGHSVAQVAKLNKHAEIGMKIFNIVAEAKKNNVHNGYLTIWMEE